MTIRRTQTIVPYAAEEMFDLVADVEKYPEFLAHCVGLRVISSNVVDGVGELEADMLVAYSAFRDRFRSRVALDRPNLKIDVAYVNGPFRRLVNAWRFREIDEGSEIDFLIEFEFKNRLLQATASSVFERVFARMSDSFVRRAAELYR